MTAVMQTHARNTEIPIDTLAFKTNVTEKYAEDITEAPETGVNIHGIYMQGAKWQD